MGDRKTLKNANGVIIGHTGSGKSMILKITEIGQTLIRTTDDIFMIDPQNEMEEITPRFGGEFFDLSPQSGICINPLETPEQILYGDDEVSRDGYIAEQTEFLEALLYAIMDAQPNGLYKSVIYRAVDTLYRRVFAKRRPVSPVLSDLRDVFREIYAETQDPEAEELYKSLTAYTDYGYKTLGGQSSFETTKRFVVFGMHHVSSGMWEPIMLTVMHVLAQRIRYNQHLQRATHFIVDEAQYVCTHENSAQELRKAFLTYRKYGGICTICIQNAAFALANDKIQDIVSNSDFKILLDQGGRDRNLIAQILDMSESEFKDLANPEIGQCLLVWGDKIIPCDSRISKDNPLYRFYTTNFHEKAEELHDEKEPKE